MAQDFRLDRFQEVLEAGLLKICSALGWSGDMMISPDIEGKWDEFLKDYVADAVENFNDYPDAALGFAAFLGMAVAFHWDLDWERYKGLGYRDYYGIRGFDDMDDHITRDILLLGDETDRKLRTCIGSCVQATQGLLRHESIDTSSEQGFYVLVRCYEVLFRIGAHLTLSRLGYRKVPVGK